MTVFSRDPREHWLKPHFSKNEVAKSGYTISAAIAFTGASLHNHKLMPNTLSAWPFAKVNET